MARAAEAGQAGRHVRRGRPRRRRARLLCRLRRDARAQEARGRDAARRTASIAAGPTPPIAAGASAASQACTAGVYGPARPPHRLQSRARPHPRRKQRDHAAHHRRRRCEQRPARGRPRGARGRREPGGRPHAAGGDAPRRGAHLRGGSGRLVATLGERPISPPLRVLAASRVRALPAKPAVRAALRRRPGRHSPGRRAGCGGGRLALRCGGGALCCDGRVPSRVKPARRH